MITVPHQATGRLLAAGLLLLAWTARAGEPTRARPTPLRFESEIVRLRVRADSLTVEGFYVLSCDPDRTGFTTLLYPYPDDPRLGGARTLELSTRVRPDAVWQPAEYRELPHDLGAHWRLPLAPGDTLEVRTVYRQALHETYARYIVTTVHGWRHPLRRARFEITLPPDAEPMAFSFPFAPCDSIGPGVWCYEATDFRPDRDIEVRWR